jgi:sporulation protein YlmC with PRC-barrel domain
MLNAKTATALALALGLTTGVAAIGPAGAAEQRGATQTQQQGVTGSSQSQSRYTVGELRTRADELIGKDVVNQQGKSVGELQDIVVDKQRNEPYAVIEVGGMLGVGAKEIAVPFSDLQLGEDNITMMSQKSEEQLKAMPAYKESDYTPLRESGRSAPQQQQQQSR